MKEASVAHNPLEAKTDCIHCGFCLPVCPTYLELGSEADSPRGRIYMMKGVQEGTLPIDAGYEKHIYLCLGCRACESACPSGVEFSALLDVARADIEKNYPRPAWQRFLKTLILGKIVPYPRRLYALFRVLRWYQISGLQRLIRKTGILRLFPGNLDVSEKLLPTVPPPSYRIKRGTVFPAKGERRYRIAFFVGCVMNEVQPQIHRATIRVLTENGCEVIVPEEQVCCGALQNHAGERETAQTLARKNMAAFEKYDYDYLVINSAGCGALLKEYPRLLSDQTAETFSAQVKDVSELLAQIQPLKPMGTVRCKVAYDDPCHLIHGQKISMAPRLLLKQIPGLELVPLQGADQCCGSAGIYNITHQEMSQRLLERKMQSIVESQAEVVATGNPGCILQISSGARKMGLPIEVLHPIELIDRAYQSN